MCVKSAGSALPCRPQKERRREKAVPRSARSACRGHWQGWEEHSGNFVYKFDWFKFELNLGLTRVLASQYVFLFCYMTNGKHVLLLYRGLCSSFVQY